MYSVQLDENKFYTGNYATLGRLIDGIEVDELPPIKNQRCYYLKETTEKVNVPSPVLIYTQTIIENTQTKYIFDGVEISEEEYNALSDIEKNTVEVINSPIVKEVTLTKEEYDLLSEKEKSEVVISYETDIDGNLVYENKEETRVVNEWVYSENKYNELKALEEEKENNREKTDSEKITELETQVSTLQSDNESLLEQIELLDSTLSVMLEDILPSIVDSNSEENIE